MWLQASSEVLGRGLDAVATVTIIIGLLQQHHIKVIQPHVESSASDSTACINGLATLIRSVEDRVLASMQAILNAFFAQVHCSCMCSQTVFTSPLASYAWRDTWQARAKMCLLLTACWYSTTANLSALPGRTLSAVSDIQMDRTLSSEQKRIDFRPPEDLPPPLDRPTDACLFATALLTTAAKSVQQTLQGSNSSAFTSEVSPV